MKNTLRQVFHSSKFLVGFIIFAVILLTMWIYPLFNPGNPLEMIGVGTFAHPLEFGPGPRVFVVVGSEHQAKS